MKKYVVLFVALFAGLLIAGCSPIYKTTYTYQPPRAQTGKMCTAQCMQTKNMCQQMCSMRNENCVAQARAEANQKFQAYRAERLARNETVDRTESFYDDSYRCNSLNNCNCTADFNICYANCGGVVEPHQVCTAFCDKA